MTRAHALGLALAAGCGSSTAMPTNPHVTVPTAEDEPWVYPDRPILFGDDALDPAAVAEADPEPGTRFDPDFGQVGTALAATGDGCTDRLPWPGPVTGGGDVIGFVDRRAVRTASWVCDLGDRVVVVDASEGEDPSAPEGKLVTGSAWSLPRKRGRTVRAPIDPASDGCVGMMACHYRTAKRALGTVRVEADGYVYTRGSVATGPRDPGEACLATPYETRALCTTARHTVAVWPTACQIPAGPDEVKLELGIYDAGASHSTGDDGAVPERTLYGTLATATGDEWSYGFTDAAGGAATLIVHTGGSPSALVNIDGVDEDCVAFAFDAR